MSQLQDIPFYFDQFGGEKSYHFSWWGNHQNVKTSQWIVINPPSDAAMARVWTKATTNKTRAKTTALSITGVQTCGYPMNRFKKSSWKIGILGCLHRWVPTHSSCWIPGTSISPRPFFFMPWPMQRFFSFACASLSALWVPAGETDVKECRSREHRKRFWKAPHVHRFVGASPPPCQTPTWVVKKVRSPQGCG